MKLSLQFLQDYVDLGKVTHQQLVDQITEKVAEVDELEVQGEFLEHCVVGKVLTVQQHPNADRLKVCTVQTDKGIKPVVCGGSNLYEGMFVAFAHVGATVKWHGTEVVTLEPVKLRGEPSEGMICASEELGIEDLYPSADEKSIVDLGAQNDKLIGTPLKEFLGLNDAIIHIDNHAITHRSDLFSHIGFARELVAMGLATWIKDPTFAAPKKLGKQPLPKFKVEDASTMPRYMSCAVKIDAMGTTPDWMLKRLQSCGWRSINLPVDITNFVLLETGLPLHSFDLDGIKGTITMRSAKQGETIITLDKSEREMNEGALILEDDAGIFDLLGIMGGLRGSTTENSRTLYVHAASLDTVRIRTAMMKMGHRTDAGTVYEKGVQPYTVEQGFYRALQLMLDLIPGAEIVSDIESIGATNAMPPVTVSIEHMCKQLGFSIENARIEQILTDLGCTVVISKDAMTVKPPLWRRDLTGAHDITEEVARMYGYNAIEPVMPEASTVPPKRDLRLQTMRCALQQSGYLELLPLSLVGPKLIDACGFSSSEAVSIADPIGEELSIMQPSVLCTLLQHATMVDTTKNHNGATFTVGHVFRAGGIEYNQFGILLRANTVKLLTSEPCLRLQNHIITMGKQAGMPFTFVPLKEVAPYIHPGRKTMIQTASGVPVGKLFQVHPAVLADLNIEGTFACALLNADVLLAESSGVSIAKSAPAYPAITYDATFTWNLADPLEPLLQKAKAACTLLESVVLVDVFSKTLPSTAASVTVRFTYRSATATLKEAELAPEHAKVLALFPAIS